MEQILIIGAGASGLTAAIFAARSGCSVCVLEALSRPASKLLSTGNGKCNFSNTKLDFSCYRGNDVDVIKPIIDEFDTQAAIDFMKSIGIASTDRQGYLYPMSGQAASVVDCLIMEARQLGVRIVTECPVKNIIMENNGLVWTAVTEGGSSYRGKRLILAAGSYAGIKKRRYRDGMLLARALKLSMAEPIPALTALIAQQPVKDWAGVRTECSIGLYADGVLMAKDRGEVQLTDYGISGIPAFQVSRYASCALKEKKNVFALLNFMPSMSCEGFISELEDRICLKRENAAQQLIGLFNSKLIPVLLKRAGINEDRQLNKKDISRLAEAVFSFVIKIQDVNPLGQSQVCAGGVLLSEVDLQSMQAKSLPGLYLAGELLDVDGRCGGYNLHWCWASGRLAGLAAARDLKKFQ